MITRPLELASKLRPEPRNFDFLFLVNVGLTALLFSLCGSKFVLAPGLGVDFQMPKMPGANAGAAPTTHVISVQRSGLIFIDNGLVGLPQLSEWLKVQAKKTRQPSLLVRADASVPLDELTAIVSAAGEAGFVRVVCGALDPTTGAGSGR